MSDGTPGAGRLAFRRLAVRRMPGFEEGGFTLDELSPGVNVIHGPNGSGKTTAGRALRLLLWPGSGDVDASLGAVLDLGGERWEIDLDRDRRRHLREGAPTDPPPLPPSDAADRYALALHELLQGDARGEELAAAVAREAAGGYDLEAARQAVGARAKPKNPAKLRGEYEGACTEVRAIEAAQRQTAAEADGLARLEAELAAARGAAARLERLEAALEWTRCQEGLARAEAALAGFPAAMERLTGEEGARLEEARDRLAQALEERERAAAALEAEHRRLAEADLPEAGLPDGLLEALGEHRERLASLEQEIAQGEGNLAGARRLRAEARRELGDDADEQRLGALQGGAWRELVDLARRGELLRARRLELDALASWLGDPAPVPELDRRLESLGAEARLLRSWLRASDGGWRARLPALAGALVLAALAVAGGLLVHPGLWALAGLAVVVVLWCWVDVRQEARSRSVLEAQHRHLAEAEPTAWRRDGVVARLAAVEEGAVAARAERQRAERSDELRSRRDRLAAELAALEAERRGLVGRLGLAPAVGDLETAPLAAMVHALCRWRDARDAVAAGEAAVESARERFSRGLEAVRGALAPYGAGVEVVDAASARGAVEALGRRSEAHRRAAEAMERLGAERERAEKAVEGNRAGCRELFARLGLDDGADTALAGLLERLETYREAVRACQEAGTALRLAADRLAGDEDLRQRDPAALEAEREAVAAVAARREELLERLARLRERIAHAKRQHELEDALARRAEKEEALRDERERETGAVVAWTVVEWLRERTRGLRRPAVMARAAGLFTRITGGAFRLLDPVGDPPVFRAEDTRNGASRDLAELSAGRRLQLLVAVRMGFIEEQERGVRVPLVMDETLANSDDAAAGALIQAVLELAREGRQVFYFTAQADEVAKWRAALESGEDGPEAKVIDLAEVRRLEAAARRPGTGWRPEPAAVPSPGKLGREAYAELLRVPGLDPRGSAGAVHLWYLVEEPAALHEILVRGVGCWGELEALAGDGDRDLLGVGPEGARRRAQVAARARCLQVLFRSWRAGRGRPVDRSAIADSGAVSERFLDEVTDLAERAGGDAKALLESLRAGEVRGFRGDKIEQLEGFLRDRGHLDDRPVLSGAELRAAALSELAREVRAGDLTLAAIDELLAQLPP